MTTDTIPTPPGWAGRRGLTRLEGESPAQRPGPEDAARREAILDVVHRYAGAYDDQDLEELERLFTPDMVWRVVLAGHDEMPPQEGRDTVLAWVAASMAEQPEQRRHVFANHRVYLVGETKAQVLVNLLLFSTGVSEPILGVAGLYRMDLRQDPETREWGINTILSAFDAPSGMLA